jgi:monoamine oxidase
MIDAIVIGGGAAGLAAAGALAGRGAGVILLEARDRLGGRILTERDAGLPIPIELGAEFIHGEAETTFAVADAALLPIDELPDEHHFAEAGSFHRVADFWGEIDRVRARIGGGDDRSFAEFLARQRTLSPRARRMALDFVRGYHAADPERISALALAAGDEESRASGQNRQYRIVTGYASLADALRASCGPRTEIRLATIAHTVTWKRGEVSVRASGATGADVGTLRARALVVAVPAAVLKAQGEAPGAIRFDPPLGRVERDLAAIETGHVVKVVLRFRERFWDEGAWLRARMGDRKQLPPLNFIHAPGEAIPTWWTPAPARAPILTGWCGGPQALALAAGGTAALIERAADALARALRERRSRIDALLEGARWHDWSGDPYARGAYSWVAVGGLPAQRRLSTPLEGTIFIAGEATSVDETGTVSGAIASGQRAARQVWRALAARKRG